MSENNEQPANILVVDDTLENLQILDRMLRMKGYEVRPCLTGKEALKTAQHLPPDLILLDVNMPGMNGYEVCGHLKADERLADIPVIFISALSDTSDKVKAFRWGAVDYITKPFHFEEVHARVETHLQMLRFRLALADHNTRLKEMVDEKIGELLRAKEEKSDAQIAIIHALSKVSEARDNDTGKHIERVQSYCELLSRQLLERSMHADTIDAEYVDTLSAASPLHDIGKVAIPDAILFKPGSLTEDEFAIMKTHSIVGAENLEHVQRRHPNNQLIVMGIEIARSHHEKWNGKGYPDGLAGEAIPLSARILAIADVYDALRTKRCYKDAFSHEKSVSIIEQDSGTHFDPELGALFVELEPQFELIHTHLSDE